MAKSTALITGASSGIGRELARRAELTRLFLPAMLERNRGGIA
jgi:short-subunit dehydrogenase